MIYSNYTYEASLYVDDLSINREIISLTASNLQQIKYENGELIKDDFHIEGLTYAIFKNFINQLLNMNIMSNSVFSNVLYNGNIYKGGNIYDNRYSEYDGDGYTKLTRTSQIYTGKVYPLSRKLDDTDKLAYLNNFPMNVQEGEFDEICCNLLNIIATEVANIFYKEVVFDDQKIDFSDLIDVLSTIGEILHDKELTQPILINQNNTENFASLENEDWDLENEY